MVSTRQAGKTRKAADGNPPPVDSGDEYEEPDLQPNKTRGVKRARATKNKSQRKSSKKVKLWMLPEMPIDILYEIFTLVHPRDLLHISWTAKALNGFLTNKSSRHVWQASFMKILESGEVPPCPSGMTEMGYANLLYGRNCMNCACDRAPLSFWCALVRLCGPCVEKMSITWDDAWPDNLSEEVVDNISDVLPTFNIRYGNRGARERILLSDKERLRKELKTAGKKLQQGVIEKYMSLVDERTEFSDAMLALEKAAEKAKEDARADVQERRIERIWERLSEDGWREEIETNKSTYERGLLKIKGVVMARPLGEKAWAELRGPLNEFMKEESRLARVQESLDRVRARVGRIKKVVYPLRFSLPHPHDFFPSTADICCSPEVREAIVNGTDEEFQKCETELQSRIPEMSATWLEERRKFFLQLLPQDSPTPEHLALVTTLFDCTMCHGASGMHIDKALSHACGGYGYSQKHSAEFFNTSEAQLFFDRVGAPWDLGRFEYSTNLSSLVRKVVLECGENPDVITVREMNKKHHRFARFGGDARGYGGDGMVAVLSWLETVEHLRNRRKHVPCRFLRPDELPEYVPELENQHWSDWGCLHCWVNGKSDWHNMMLDTIKDHLAESHQITNATEEDYYHKDPNRTCIFVCKPGRGI